MTFPAWFDLMGDPAILKRPAAQRLYAKLLKENPRIFYEPKDVKAWLEAEETGMSPDTVNAALDLLTERGYLLEHGRDGRGIRKVTMATTRAA